MLVVKNVGNPQRDWVEVTALSRVVQQHDLPIITFQPDNTRAESVDSAVMLNDWNGDLIWAQTGFPDAEPIAVILEVGLEHQFLRCGCENFLAIQGLIPKKQIFDS